MKKIIQIALIVVLVLGFFQAAAGGSVISSEQMGSSDVTHLSSMSDTSAPGAQMAACLVRVKGVICVTPNVGWNS
jgi:hypothetical protein